MEKIDSATGWGKISSPLRVAKTNATANKTIGKLEKLDRISLRPKKVYDRKLTKALTQPYINLTKKRESKIPRKVVKSEKSLSHSDVEGVDDSLSETFEENETEFVEPLENSQTSPLKVSPSSIEESPEVFERGSEYRRRKSLSLMDFSRLNGGSLHRNNVSPRRGANIGGVKTLSNYSGKNPIHSQGSLGLNEKLYAFVKESEIPEISSRLAGLKIFASIMLNAWRRRRDDVRRLSEEVNRLRKGSIKSKNQIHVISSLFKVEQKQNDDLNGRLRHVLEEQHKIKNLYEKTNITFQELKGSSSILEVDLKAKTAECENLDLVVQNLRSDLHKSMATERSLDCLLAIEQRKILELENDKNDLLNKLTSKDSHLTENIKKLESDLKTKNAEIDSLNVVLDMLEKKLGNLKGKEAQVKHLEEQDINHRKIINELTEQIENLQQEIDSSLKNRLMEIAGSFPYKVVRYLHIFAFYILPNVPIPKKSLPSLAKPTESAKKCSQKSLNFV